LFAALN